MSTPRAFREFAHAVLLATVFLIAAGAALHWAWNLIGAEMFGAPKAEYRHGVALALALLVLALPFARAGRRIPPRPESE